MTLSVLTGVSEGSGLGMCVVMSCTSGSRRGEDGNLKRVRARLVVQRSGVVHILQIVRYVYSMFCFGCGQLCEAETEFGFFTVVYAYLS